MPTLSCAFQCLNYSLVTDILNEVKVQLQASNYRRDRVDYFLVDGLWITISCRRQQSLFQAILSCRLSAK